MGYFSEKDIERYLYGKDEYRDREIFGYFLNDNVSFNENPLLNEGPLKNERDLTLEDVIKLKEEAENGY